MLSNLGNLFLILSLFLSLSIIYRSFYNYSYGTKIIKPYIFTLALWQVTFVILCFLSLILGFIFNISGLSLPTFANDALSLVAGAALPAALFSLGGILIQYKPEGDKLAILMVCTIGLVLHPAIVWTLGTSLSVTPEFFKSGVLTAAMAPGVNAYIFANLYGRAKRIAASSVLIATGSSVITIWFWLTALG